jgi:hypothetical protein
MRNNRTLDLSAKETWSGGYYETAIMLGRRRDAFADERLRSAILAIWATSYLRNPAPNKSDLAAMRQVDLDTVPPDKIGELFGYMLHEEFGAIPFKTCVVRETPSMEGWDWLYGAVPLGGLAAVRPEVGGWPFGDYQDSYRWRKPLEEALAEITIEVSRTIAFQVSAIGFEISGNIEEEARIGLYPAEREVGYVAQAGGAYTYFPTTRWD